MSLEELTYRPSETLIYLTEQGDGGFRGFAEHSATGQIFRFDNIPEMFRVHELLFNSLHYPESAGVTRGGLSGSRLESPEVYSRKELSLPDDPVFALRVLYRQNACWQGTLRWIPGKTTWTFRSTLELLLLFDQVNHGNGMQTGRKD